jgi:Glycosyltransferase 61
MFMKTQFPKKKFTRNPPANIAAEHIAYFRMIESYEAPELLVYEFESVNLLPDSTLFEWFFPLDISFPFFKKRLRHHNYRGILSILLNWKRLQLNKEDHYLVIHDVWTSNYYHWITQALPRLILAQQTGKSYKLILPDDHQTEFHKISLELLGVRSYELINKGRQYYKVQKLLYPTHDIQVGDYHDDLMRLLRGRLTEATEDVIANKRIFISRASRERRIIINEAEVFSVFKDFGFEIVEFEKLSFKEQIRIMRTTMVVAGVHGAGLTNMLFMSPGARVFELTTVVNGENYYFYTLANALGHSYYYQLCDVDQQRVIQDANLIVDISTLKTNIQSIITSL